MQQLCCKYGLRITFEADLCLKLTGAGPVVQPSADFLLLPKGVSRGCGGCCGGGGGTLRLWDAVCFSLLPVWCGLSRPVVLLPPVLPSPQEGFVDVVETGNEVTDCEASTWFIHVEWGVKAMNTTLVNVVGQKRQTLQKNKCHHRWQHPR